MLKLMLKNLCFVDKPVSNFFCLEQYFVNENKLLSKYEEHFNLIFNSYFTLWNTFDIFLIHALKLKKRGLFKKHASKKILVLSTSTGGSGCWTCRSNHRRSKEAAWS